MTIESELRVKDTPHNRAARLYLVVLLVLLLAEIAGLAVCFDTGVLAGENGAAAWLLGRARLLAHPGLTSLVIALALCGSQVWDPLRSALESPQSLGQRTWLLAAHLACYLALWTLSGLLLGGRFAALAYPTLVACAWGIAVLATFGLWVAVLLPPVTWPDLRAPLRHGMRAFTLGILVGVLAWWMGELTEGLWRPLARGTMWFVGSLLSLWTGSLVYRPSDFVIGTETFQVAIAPECSGYEGIGLIWAFVAAHLWIFRAQWRFPQAFLLLPAGTIAIWFANGIRITILILIGTYHSPQLALGGFHSQAGAFAFAAVGLALVGLAQRLPWLSGAGAASGGPNQAAPYVVPMIVLLACSMLTQAFTTGLDVLYPLRVIAVGGVLWFYRHELLRRSPPSTTKPFHWTARDWLWGFVIGAAVFALWLALEPFHTASQAPSSTGGPWQWPAVIAIVWLVFRTLGSVVTVPIAEELAFRGFLMRRIVAADFTSVAPRTYSWTSMLISSAAFGALHGRWIAGTLAGLCYAGAMRRRGSLGDAVLAHSVTNALVTAGVLFTGEWSFWS